MPAVLSRVIGLSEDGHPILELLAGHASLEMLDIRDGDELFIVEINASALSTINARAKDAGENRGDS